MQLFILKLVKEVGFYKILFSENYKKMKEIVEMQKAAWREIDNCDRIPCIFNL